MKKTYIIPEIEVVTLMTTNTMLVLSAELSNEVEITNSDDFGTKDEGDWDDVWD